MFHSEKENYNSLKQRQLEEQELKIQQKAKEVSLDFFYFMLFKVEQKEIKLKELTKALKNQSKNIIKDKLNLQTKFEKYTKILEEIERIRDGQNFHWKSQ